MEFSALLFLQLWVQKHPLYVDVLTPLLTYFSPFLPHGRSQSWGMFTTADVVNSPLPWGFVVYSLTDILVVYCSSYIPHRHIAPAGTSPPPRPINWSHSLLNTNYSHICGNSNLCSYHFPVALGATHSSPHVLAMGRGSFHCPLDVAAG